MDQQPGRRWFDGDAGPLVRPYARTGGRTSENRHRLDMLTLLVVRPAAPPLRRIESEYAEIVRVCDLPQSVAEVSAQLGTPMAVTKILIGDLIADGILQHQDPVTSESATADVTLLRAVLAGIRRL